MILSVHSRRVLNSLVGTVLVSKNLCAHLPHKQIAAEILTRLHRGLLPDELQRGFHAPRVAEGTVRAAAADADSQVRVRGVDNCTQL